MILVRSSEEILNQLIMLIRQLNNNDYKASVNTLSGSSIGGHVRHIIEFYECLIRGYESGLVNYDARQRNIQLETKADYAIDILIALSATLNTVKKDRMLMLSMDLSSGDHPVVIDTTFYRELAYNIEHAIHHMAIIKIAVQSEHVSVIIPENFGVAYSTLKFKMQNICAQ
jgi:hypothetical protein